jgi:hypothetical protein
MLRQADEHFKVVAPFFTSLSPIEYVLISPSLFRVYHSDAMPSYGRASEDRTLPKLWHWLKSLSMFTFRAIIFHAVWHQECLSIWRN